METLLAYLPSAEDETVTAEVQLALAALASRDGKPEPAMLRALEDKVEIRRSAAAMALCQSAGGAVRLQVRKLLQDPEPAVRLRVALALARSRDKEAVPVLISLLAELPHIAQFQNGEAEHAIARRVGERVRVPLKRTARIDYGRYRLLVDADEEVLGRRRGKNLVKEEPHALVRYDLQSQWRLPHLADPLPQRRYVLGT